MSPSNPTELAQSKMTYKGGERLNASVVFLVNFVAPNHLAVMRDLAERVKRLTILSSVEMEGNRAWQSDWKDLDVRVQSTWTIERNIDHPSGFQEVNYVHLPLDTFSQLRQIKPDVIVSLELGARTAMARLYQKVARRCAMVTSVYASERSETGRGFFRLAARKRLLSDADWVTFNGPSCREYLLSLGADPERMSSWDYAADPTKFYRGSIPQVRQLDPLRILTVGQLSRRKGVREALLQLSEWSDAHPEQSIHWHLVGTGPLERELRESVHSENLSLHFHDHCQPNQIADHYRDCDVLLFPTLADEWGLVVDESLHSGLPVIGSIHSQAVTTLIHEGQNGYVFDPEQRTSLEDALNQFISQPHSALERMKANCRRSVSARTPEVSSMQLLHAIHCAMQMRLGAKAINLHSSLKNDPQG